MMPNEHTKKAVGAKDSEATEAEELRRMVQSGAGIGYRVATFTVFLIAAVVFFVFFVSSIAHVLELFTLGVLIAMAINPAVVWLEKRRVRRIVSVTGLIVLIAGMLGGGIATLAPSLLDQSTRFVQDVPNIGRGLQKNLHWLDKRFPALNVPALTTRLQDEASQSLSNIKDTAIAGLTASVTTVVESILVLFIVVFVLTDPDPLVRGLRGLFPPAWQVEVVRIGELIVGKVQAWIQGTLILMLAIAVMDTVGLMFLGVPYALLWGVFSGLMEVIPTLGPIIAAVPPAIVGLTMHNPVSAVYVLILYTVIQQVESNILVPLIMSNKVRLHPVTLLFFLLMMAEFLGVFGALIATPLAAVIKVLYVELYYRRLHGTLPPEELNDPLRLKRKKLLARKAREDTAP
jgi:predicted PurR-regulated permease PerM